MVIVVVVGGLKGGMKGGHPSVIAEVDSSIPCQLLLTPPSKSLNNNTQTRPPWATNSTQAVWGGWGPKSGVVDREDTAQMLQRKRWRQTDERTMTLEAQGIEYSSTMQGAGVYRLHISM